MRKVERMFTQSSIVFNYSLYSKYRHNFIFMTGGLFLSYCV